MKKGMLFSFVLTLLLVITACAGGDAETTDKEITVYTAVEDDMIEPYLSSFKEKYPDITVNIVRDSTGVITSKLLAEKDNPKADVVWGLAATSLLVADQEGMLEAYAPEGIERIADQYKDTTNEQPHWVGIDAWLTGIAVNTVELEEKGLEIPRTYEDLLDPQYEGMITMPNPASSGTGFLSVSGLMQLMGEDDAWNYMDKLHQNIGMYTHSGSKPGKLAAQGEYPIGITQGYRGIIEAQKGAPIETIFPEQGSGWDLEANALVKKETIKEEAKLFLDWAISDEAMKEYSENFAITTVPTDKPVPEGFPENPASQLIENDFNWAAENRDTILDEWTKRYDGKSAPK
ncbi:phosphonate ABC transporter substrate-binding protein [Pontibacillus halophilus JSM 076056 = DSM 19796]|uniref:Phosphonate ABC transporter substrate-binding protein n=1 Tax=Pontibacillus halophilus JSM 076056 = DSM 19796 TaxID=1385510 RepID=A0A0A5GLA0_9BACI|nr:putative 2-aminoethylphosphonate ABC transporter substrate-binding protein [Pontibacillus halophilus]KGX94021.1 phosphonate ABC transporter substrate-binding protein [Pontibacillus halophilus JSM 076056 = DSM 19796]